METSDGHQFTVYAKHGTISRILLKKILRDANIAEDQFLREY